MWCCFDVDCPPKRDWPPQEDAAVRGSSGEVISANELENILLEGYEKWKRALEDASHRRGTAGNIFIGKPERSWRIGWWNIQNLSKSKCRKGLDDAIALVIWHGGMQISYCPSRALSVTSGTASVCIFAQNHFDI